MNTMKKLAAFIIILLMLGGTLVLFAGSRLSELVSGDTPINIRTDTVIMGEDGAVYLFAITEGENVLTRLHGDGRIERQRVLPQIGSAREFYISSILCSANGSLFISAYRVNEDTTGIISSDIYLIRPDWKEIRCLRSVPCEEDLYYEALDRHQILNIREDGDATLFLSADDGVYTVLTYNHATDELSAGASFSGDVIPVTGVALDPATLLLGLQGGSVLGYKDDGEELIWQANTPGALLSRFMYTEKGVYFIEGRTGSLGKVNGETGCTASVVNCSEPQRYMIDLTGFRLFDMNSAGQFAAMTEDDDLYIGSDDTFKMTLVDTSVNHNQTRYIFSLIAILLGLLLASGAVWYFYVHVMKMYLPIMVRQCFAVVFIVGVLMNIILTMFVADDMMETTEEELKNRMITMAALFASGLEANSKAFNTDIEKVSGLLYSGDSINEQLGFALYEQTENGVFIRGSSRFFEPGTNAASPALDMTMIRVVQDAYKTGKEMGFHVDPDTVLACAFVRVPGAPNWIAEVFVSHSWTTRRIELIFNSMNLQVTLTSLLLIMLLLATLRPTVRGIQNLSRGVKLLADGDMNVMIVQQTGDEMESLAHAFNDMASELSASFARMEALNRSYFRFVPEQFVSLLGSGSIESLDKNSHTRRDMGVMVIKFSFAGDDGSWNTDTLFSNINEVIEQASGIVTQNGGMAYDFAYDGFNAVFEKEPEKMVSTAIAVRHAILSLNAQRQSRGDKPVRLWIALDQGSVLLGMVGDEQRLAPTAISSALVDARRIAKLCAQLDAGILCTREVAAGAGCEEGMRCIGSGDLGGRQRVLYEIFQGDPYAIRNAKWESRERFARGVELFGAQQYAKAKQIFMDIVKLEQEDGVARRYLYLADEYAAGEKPDKGGGL